MDETWGDEGGKDGESGWKPGFYTILSDAIFFTVGLFATNFALLAWEAAIKTPISFFIMI